MGMRASNCLCTDLRPKLFPKCSYVSSVMGARTNRGALLQLCRAGGTSSDPDHRRQVRKMEGCDGSHVSLVVNVITPIMGLEM